MQVEEGEGERASPLCLFSIFICVSLSSMSCREARRSLEEEEEGLGGTSLAPRCLYVGEWMLRGICGEMWEKREGESINRLRSPSMLAYRVADRERGSGEVVGMASEDAGGS